MASAAEVTEIVFAPAKFSSSVNTSSELCSSSTSKMLSPSRCCHRSVSPSLETFSANLVFIFNFTVSETNGSKTVTGTLELFSFLNELGSANGIGRIDLVENRFVGMKSRGVYETPAGTILRIAHLDIEGLTLDREVCHLRDMLSPKIAELVYNGFWFSPEMEFLMAAIEKSQEHVEGKVYMTLYKGNAFATGRESTKSLYDASIASMDKLGNYDQTDAKGFIKLNALRLKLSAKR